MPQMAGVVHTNGSNMQLWPPSSPCLNACAGLPCSGIHQFDLPCSMKRCGLHALKSQTAGVVHTHGSNMQLWHGLLPIKPSSSPCLNACAGLPCSGIHQFALPCSMKRCGLHALNGRCGAHTWQQRAAVAWPTPQQAAIQPMPQCLRRPPLLRHSPVCSALQHETLWATCLKWPVWCTHMAATCSCGMAHSPSSPHPAHASVLAQACLAQAFISLTCRAA
jgi:hypothetical protein